MNDIDPEAILGEAPAKERRSLPRRSGPVKHTETLRASLDRVTGDLGFSDDAGITPASLELGIMLKRARRMKKLTQDELADRVGLSQTVLSTIENGRGPDGPTWSTIARICSALDIEPSFLPSAAEDSEGAPATNARIVKVSNSPKAKVRESLLDETGAALAWNMLSAEAIKWVRNSLVKAGLGSLKHAAKGKSPRILSLAPHYGTKIKADLPLILIAPAGTHIGMRAITGKALFHRGVAVLDGQSTVEVDNRGEANSLVFAVNAASFLTDSEAESA